MSLSKLQLRNVLLLKVNRLVSVYSKLRKIHNFLCTDGLGVQEKNYTNTLCSVKVGMCLVVKDKLNIL